MKLAKHKDKERILKAARDKRALTYKCRHIRVVADLSTNLAGQKGMVGDLPCDEQKKYAAKNPLPASLPFRMEGEIKVIPNKQKLKE